MNRSFRKRALQAAVSMALIMGVGAAQAIVNVQCPGDNNGDADWDDAGDAQPAMGPNGGPVKCMHLIAGDGFSVMSDGADIYTFGFADVTGAPPDTVIRDGILNNEWPGPTIELDQDDEFYLSLTNVGTTVRPDLFDPHTVHFHGFPNAAAVFDGVPEVSISINMGGTLSYYYNIKEPGTYLYHCHVEATEHMEMGMLANLFVHPLQDEIGCFELVPDPENPGEFLPEENGICFAGTRKGGPGPHTGYAYNDNDGTTAWDVEKALQLASFDSAFHEASWDVQPLPFSDLEGDYPQLNGRGYPDTIKTGELAPSAQGGGEPSQLLDSKIEVNAGDRLLLRLSNVGLDRFWTLTATGLTMKVVGTGARHMRGQDVIHDDGVVETGKNIYRETASVNFGGGETIDAIIETEGVAPGTYFLHTTELHEMSNRNQMDGGMITEIVITEPVIN